MKVSDLCGLNELLDRVDLAFAPNRCGVCGEPMGPSEGLECLECLSTCSQPVGSVHARDTQRLWERAEEG